jgi:hypothetical protein
MSVLSDFGKNHVVDAQDNSIQPYAVGDSPAEALARGFWVSATSSAAKCSGSVTL